MTKWHILWWKKLSQATIIIIYTFGGKIDQNTKIVSVTATEKWPSKIILTHILRLPGDPHCIDCFLRYITATCGPIFFVGVLYASKKLVKTFFWFIVDILMRKIDQKVTE